MNEGAVSLPEGLANSPAVPSGASVAHPPSVGAVSVVPVSVVTEVSSTTDVSSATPVSVVAPVSAVTEVSSPVASGVPSTSKLEDEQPTRSARVRKLRRDTRGA